MQNTWTCLSTSGLFSWQFGSLSMQYHRGYGFPMSCFSFHQQPKRLWVWNLPGESPVSVSDPPNVYKYKWIHRKVLLSFHHGVAHFFKNTREEFSCHLPRGAPLLLVLQYPLEETERSLWVPRRHKPPNYSTAALLRGMWLTRFM